MRDRPSGEMPRAGIRPDETAPAMAMDAAPNTIPKEPTRRAVGLNMIVGLGGLHASRGLTGRLLGSPETRPLATPVADSTLPPGLVGTWVYHNQGEAIAIIVEQLQFVFNSDGSGSITFQRVTTQFQTGCAENFIASWPDGMWDFVNGNRLNWTGAGSSIDTNSCIPGHTTMTLGSSFFFNSVRLVGNTTLHVNPVALSLTAIDDPVNPQRPLFDIALQKIAGPPAPSASALVAAVLPSSRSVQVGKAATTFATIINSGMSVATSCAIVPVTMVPARFTFQTTDPTSNAVTGTPNTPVDIAPGAAQSYVFAFIPTASFDPTDIKLGFTSTNTDPAPTISGVNTLLLSASATPVPDIVALAATASNDGILHIPGSTGTAAFAVATVNVGASSTITATANTGSATLPLTITLCQTNPQSGQCISAIGPSVTFTDNANDTPTVAVFATANGTVPFDPANNRIFVEFMDPSGIVRGATSVAVTTTQ